MIFRNGSGDLLLMSKFKSRQFLRAFTLVELALIIGVIGILSTITLTFLNPISLFKKSRDGVRLKDLVTLKSSLVLALTGGQSFTGRCPATTPCLSLTGSTAVDGTGWVDLNLSSFLSQLPRDPLQNQATFVDAAGAASSATYQFAAAGADFEIRARLESSANLEKYAIDGGDDADYYEIGTKLDIL